MRHGIGDSQLFESTAAKAKPTQLTTYAGESPCDTAPVSAEQITARESATPASLRQLMPAARFFAGDDIEFASIATDSSTAEEGELLIYRVGHHCPSQTVADAMARGAAGILTEQLLPCPLPQCIVGDIDLALATIAADRLDRPDRRLLTVGVIGSSGKTSTTLMLTSLMRASSIRTAYQCDLGQSDGVVQTTPDQAVPVGAPLIEAFAEAADAGADACVVELCEEAARHGHYDAIQFDILVVTGSASCGGDYGPSGLQCVLERVTEEGVVIASADDRQALDVIRDASCRMLTFGVRSAADVSARIMEQSGGMTTLLMSHRNVTTVMETPLNGTAMAANHAAAAVVGLLLDQPLETVVERLSQLRSIPGRAHHLSDLEQANVVLDVGGSPKRVQSTLRSQRWLNPKGKLWCILAIDSDDTAEVHANYGAILERYAEHAIVTSRPDCKFRFLADSHRVLDGVKKCAAFRLVADRERAVQWAMREAAPNDTIVVITSETGGTPLAQRSDIEALTQCVQRCRSNRVSERPPLKIFHPDRGDA